MKIDRLKDFFEWFVNYDLYKGQFTAKSDLAGCEVPGFVHLA